MLRPGRSPTYSMRGMRTPSPPHSSPQGPSPSTCVCQRSSGSAGNPESWLLLAAVTAAASIRSRPSAGWSTMRSPMLPAPHSPTLTTSSLSPMPESHGRRRSLNGLSFRWPTRAPRHGSSAARSSSARQAREPGPSSSRTWSRAATAPRGPSGRCSPRPGCGSRVSSPSPAGTSRRCGCCWLPGRFVRSLATRRSWPARTARPARHPVRTTASP
jgi:hypothetical protein